ncbi:hypothetical protein EJ08DRAFT_462441 [Tothia fuscella]|uniref:Uncharacterized protein n=1 Tax=Tothia fuscella TaxID=1048955 RepID=A0A9P4TU79_9PEZI|nr:hypothetical protein EJ08DRAFT_462441 [Tothia fuscella]
MTDQFAHVNDLPVFQIYSLNEVEILRKRIQSNLETKWQRQDIIDHMPPPPSSADALTAKVYFELISAMSDCGMSMALKQVNIDKTLANTLGGLDAMDQSFMKEDMTVVYSRWATPSSMSGAPIVVDILAWQKGSNHSKLSGVQVKANTELKIGVNKESAFTVKEGKTWNKSWFRGRDNQLSVFVTTNGKDEVELGQVLGIERNLSTVVLRDLSTRWEAFVVPQASHGKY